MSRISVHRHSPYDMIMDEDGTYSACRYCEQAWNLTPRGWEPVPYAGSHRAISMAGEKKRWKKKGSLNRQGKK